MSDYLTDEEQLARLKSFWQRNGVLLAIAVVVTVAVVVGWRWYAEHRRATIDRASDLYADYLEAQGAERETIATALATEAPRSAYVTFVRLREAGEKIEAEDFEGAEAALREALAGKPDTLLADLIRLRLARVLQTLDRSDEALATLADVRGAGFRPQVAEFKGDIHLARGERALAHESFSAALDAVGDGAQRPLLELKVADTADASSTAASGETSDRTDTANADDA